MWERNHFKAMSGAFDPEFSTDYFFQPVWEPDSFLYKPFAIDKLCYRQSADRNYELGLKNLDFIIHPRRAVTNLVWCGNTIAAARSFSGKTPADRREINLRANDRFIHAARFFEPTEKRFAGRMRKRPLQNGFPWTRRLSDDDDVANDCATGNGRRLHARATPAAK
jgi:hypothetical protein